MKFNTTQILKLFLIATILTVIPLLSASSRPKYLYFVVNLLIVALGAEAGLLASFSKAAVDEKKPPVTQKYLTLPDPNKEEITSSQKIITGMDSPKCADKKSRVVEKSKSEKIVVGSQKVQKVRKCPSTPSIFFIGGGDQSEAEEFVGNDRDEGDKAAAGDVLSGQELYHKAENFIGNFYKQLKMQKEDSYFKEDQDSRTLSESLLIVR